MTVSEPDSGFKFAISLSVLNHLGRNLYRNFITVLGEAISNSWDADAENVWIEIDRERSVFSIKDDGDGMDGEEFQHRFLKIGYSKRAESGVTTDRKRPFIGAKGIGKLALLSCAERISVYTRKGAGNYVGGTIDNSGLDEAIKSDLTPEDYPLEGLNHELIGELSDDHNHGTILIFEGTNERIRNSIAHIRKMLALSFRFSLLDPGFTIHVNGEAVGADDLTDLNVNTEFIWIINQYQDPFVSALRDLKHSPQGLTTSLDVRGFIASVAKPRHLKITGTDERATVDLFVNGRLREKGILRHIPSQRIVESYLYGQIHFDSMDSGEKDPFTSSREAIVQDDPDFGALLEYLRSEALSEVFDKWDALRLGRGETGDVDNKRKSRKERNARDLYAAARDEFAPDDDAPKGDEVEEWLWNLRDDAEFNLTSYADCFLSENLVRKYIAENGGELGESVKSAATKWRQREGDKRSKANISYEIRKSDTDLDYLGMDDLAFTAEGNKKSGGQEQSLWTDSVSYAPVRNVVGHTGLLTENAKQHLRLTFENIKARVKKLVSGKS